MESLLIKLKVSLGIILFSDYMPPYKILLFKVNKATTNVNRLRTLCIEIYEAFNKINSAFMNEIFRIIKIKIIIKIIIG